MEHSRTTNCLILTTKIILFNYHGEDFVMLKENLFINNVLVALEVTKVSDIKLYLVSFNFQSIATELNTIVVLLIT